MLMWIMNTATFRYVEHRIDIIQSLRHIAVFILCDVHWNGFKYQRHPGLGNVVKECSET